MEIKEIELTKDRIEELIKLSIDWENENITSTYMKNEYEDFKDYRVIACLEDDKIIGYAFIHSLIQDKNVHLMEKNSKYMYVEELYVKREYRSKGLGKLLMDYVINLSKKEGLDYVYLVTPTKNYKAILHFYIDEIGMDFYHAALYKKL